MDNSSYQERLNAFWAQDKASEFEQIARIVEDSLREYAQLLISPVTERIENEEYAYYLNPFVWCRKHPKLPKRRPHGLSAYGWESWEKYSAWYEQRVKNFLFPYLEELEKIRDNGDVVALKILLEKANVEQYNARCMVALCYAEPKHPGRSARVGRPMVRQRQLDLLYIVKLKTEKNPAFKNKSKAWLVSHICGEANRIWEEEYNGKPLAPATWKNRYSEMMKKYPHNN